MLAIMNPSLELHADSSSRYARHFVHIQRISGNRIAISHRAFNGPRYRTTVRAASPEAIAVAEHCLATGAGAWLACDERTEAVFVGGPRCGRRKVLTGPEARKARVLNYRLGDYAFLRGEPSGRVIFYYRGCNPNHMQRRTG